MANLSAYYPAPIVAGTTLGTYADGASAAHVGQANTFTQNQTLNGTNNVAPNQTAASGTSLLTRDLGDARFWSQPENVTLSFTNFTGATVGGFATGQISGLLTLQGQTNPNVISTSHARFAGFPHINTAGPRQNFNYSRRMRVKLWFGVAIGSGTAPDTTVHYIIPTVTGYTAGVPAHRSFGFVVGATGINGFTHDGTNYTLTSTGVAWAANTNYYGLLENDGAGNYSFWLNSGSGLASLGTIAGPTGTHGAEHLFGANVASTAINNMNFYYIVRSLEISLAAS
jgi:hypothetical protein